MVGSGEANRNRIARIVRQLRADAEDRATDPEGGTANPTRAGVADCLLDEASRCAVAGWGRVAESLLEIAIEVEQSGDLEEAREGRRFSVADLGMLLDQMSSVSRPLASSEAEELKRRDAEPKTSGDHWDWGTDRRTVIEYPRADQSPGERTRARASGLGAHRSHASGFQYALGPADLA